MVKEFLYVGHYYDAEGNFILKIGTTNNLERRQQEHTRKYKTVKNHKMSQEGSFVYDWSLPLSHNNTLRYEAKNREAWKEIQVGKFVPNDRFYCEIIPEEIQVKIRKIYTIKINK